MHHPLSSTLFRGRAARRAGLATVAALGVTAAFASAASAATPTIAVTGDSVVVTGADFGAGTVTASRPDALTGKPVVIGQYTGFASSVTPFSVNTTAPSALAPSGDCWQKGALASALTPDLQPGDTVAFTQPSFTGTPTSTSVTVSADNVKDAVGPIAACKSIAPWAKNAVTSSSDHVDDGGSIALSGVAQPGAAQVSLAASDGQTTTSPVAAAPASDGTWSATIPASEVGRLAAGTVAVTPVFQVQDVSTGATANVSAGSVSLLKASANPPANGPATGGTPTATVVKVAGLHSPKHVGLRFAHRKGIRTAFFVPAGASVVRVQLSSHRKVILTKDVKAVKAGTKQVVRLTGPRVRRLKRGKYQVAVRAGASVNQLGPAVTATTVVR